MNTEQIELSNAHRFISSSSSKGHPEEILWFPSLFHHHVGVV